MHLASVRVLLSKTHWEYVSQSLDLPKPLLERLKAQQHGPDKKDRVEVSLTIEDADDIRSRCAERLQLQGLADDYEPNPEGRLLEDLIDLFFTG